MNIISIRVLILLFIICSQQMAANPLDDFLTREHINPQANVKFILYNPKECLSCNLAGKFIHEELAKTKNYYILVYKVKASKANYFVEKEFKIRLGEGNVIVDNGLFEFLSPDLGSKVVALENGEVYFNQDIAHVKMPFEIKSLNSQILFSDSFRLKENIVPLYAEDYSVTSLKNGNFIFHDKLFANVILYDAKGNQTSLFANDSIHTKEVYGLFSKDTSNWKWVEMVLKNDKKYLLPVPSSLEQIHSDDGNLQVLMRYRFPQLMDSMTNERNYDLTGYVIFKYDSNLKVSEIKRVIAIKGFPYDFNRNRTFNILKDRLYTGIFKFKMNLDSGEVSVDSSVRLFAEFKIDTTSSAFDLFKILGKMPAGYKFRKQYKDLLDNKIFTSSNKKANIALFRNAMMYYDFNYEKYYPVVSAFSNEGLDLSLKYAHPELIFFVDLPVEKSMNFICKMGNSYYLVSNNRTGKFVKRIKILTSNDTGEIQFFQDKSYLYAIKPGEEHIYLIKYSLKDF